MLKRFIYAILERRHYWRYVDFAELAELYASRVLRVLAVSMITVFVGLYLYQNGYSLAFILGYFAIYFVFRALVTFPAAHLIARIGPKHANLVSNLLYVPSLLAISTLGEYGLYALAVFGIFQAFSTSLYEVAYLVNFSKVKKDDHVGKEISYMYILEKVAMSASPVIGGVIAFLLGPQATMITAAVLFAIAAMPLLFTGEPVPTRQKIIFRSFNWRESWRGIVAHMGYSADVVASTSLWGLFVAIAVLHSTDNDVYAQVGALSSVALVASLVFAKLYGRLIDRRRGGELLRFGVVADALIHLARPFITTPVGVVMTNIVNEGATIAYVMPFTKGMFDMADRLPGYRIVYMSLMSAMGVIGAALYAGVLSLLALILPEVMTMQIGFVAVAFIVLIIMKHGFPALAPRRFF